jgi:hypothetical protein
MNENVSPQTVGTERQYSLAKILGIWVAAAAPMALLLAAFEFLVAPALNGAWTQVLPFFAEPPQFSIAPVLESP